MISKTFNWLNKFKACKSMNESHFIFFLLHKADMHNLKIEGKLRALYPTKMRGVEAPNAARLEALAGVKVPFIHMCLETVFCSGQAGDA